jgi:hypothetical protein
MTPMPSDLDPVATVTSRPMGLTDGWVQDRARPSGSEVVNGIAIGACRGGRHALEMFVAVRFTT